MYIFVKILFGYRLKQYNHQMNCFSFGGCTVFSVCWYPDNMILRNQIYFLFDMEILITFRHIG